jgi:methylated-DNA-protein-cysteine methyltransferase-like protein
MPTRDAILAAVAAIPPGSVRAYGDVARRAGLPGRARLVARVLADQPEGSGLPWHRVVRSGGRIAFAPGSAAFDRQRARLEAEGWKVTDSGRVVSQASSDHRSLDRMLWEPAEIRP